MREVKECATTLSLSVARAKAVVDLLCDSVFSNGQGVPGMVLDGIDAVRVLLEEVKRDADAVEDVILKME